MKKWLFTLFLVLILFSISEAQVSQTGSIRGIVSDQDGQPLPGVSVTVTSPSLIGKQTTLTNEEGVFRVPSLPPGEYEVKLELSGFKTLIRRGIIIRVGMTVELNFQMEQAEISEEVTVVATAPTVDIVNTKNSKNITEEVLARVPLARSVYSAIQLAPGTVERTIHGSARNDAAYSIDGVVTNAPDQNYGEANISWDMVEEIELITSGATSEAFNAIGGYINVVTKSGGNRFSGAAQAYYTNEDMAKVIMPEESLETLGLSKPEFPKYDWETSGTLGGPIFRDRLWFLGNFRLARQSRYGRFKPTVILGKNYETYDWLYNQYWGFLKLTTQLRENIRAFFMVSYHNQHRPTISRAWYLTKEANTDHRTKAWTGTGNINWTLNSNTFVDARYGFWYFNYDGTTPVEDVIGQPSYWDGYTSYEWGYPWASDFTRKRVAQGSIKLTRFQDDFLGGDHEFKTGFEIDRSSGGWGFYKPNPLTWGYYNGNPYYYRGLYGINHPDPVNGDGTLSFAAYGPEMKDDQGTKGIKTRFSVFMQDAYTVLKNRLSINFGVRYDHISTKVPVLKKYAANSSVAIAIGNYYFKPEYGFNPFEEITYPEWDNPFPYDFIGYNVGFSWDPIGDAKTALKASFGRYAEGLPTWYYDEAHPIGGAAGFDFDWFDLNENGQPDAPPVDKYVWTGGANPRQMVDIESMKLSIDPDVKIPFNYEFHTSIERELFRDFKLSVGYIYRTRKNLISNPYYDVETGTYWSDADSGYWVPFHTTIPAYGEFPATDVTMYFMKADHPDIFNRVTNIKGGKVKYEAIELAFEKRMSHGWQLGGSVVLSRNKGNFTISSGWVYGQFNNPNQLINAYGDQPYSRPLVAKLYGSYILPYRFVISFFYTHSSGSPWNRTVRVVPPAEWAAEHGTNTWSYSIFVEPRGTRRNQSQDNVDLRLEKEFVLGSYGRLGVFVDIFNLFGYTNWYIQANPGGTWKPDNENTLSGTFIPSWTGLTGHSGTRLIKVSIRYSF